jgi:hypothetical protein
LEIS